ncbi:hypothetical protein [Dyella amyloliquefaciens]|uniref:hypothetical protein n=1 Tax=Dyella amyloliquefaciens TaxID=1770545 RepID=UPI00102EA71F|nr:hypothetical protein [Dyella amyloliquefaciens]
MSTYAPNEFAAKVGAIIASLDAALSTGVKQAITLTNRAAIALLSGGRKADPWTYPVPIRTPGGLRANQATAMASPISGYVINTSAYAVAIHSGLVPEWAGRGKHRMTQRTPRPFLDDAVAQVQPLTVVQGNVEEALKAWA